MDIGSNKIKFKINNQDSLEGIEFIGELVYSEDSKIEIDFTLIKNHHERYYKLFEENIDFNICGKFDNNKKFTAQNCYITNITQILSYLINPNKSYPCKIYISSLYLNDCSVNDNLLVNKADIEFSNIPIFLDNKKIYIDSYECYFSLGKIVTIESKKEIKLKDMNEIIFNLNIFFQVIALNKDVKQIKKFFYKKTNKQIEYILKRKSNKENKTNIEFLISDYDSIDLNDTLNRWFIAKQKYGKVFNYLSGILKDSSISYVEFQYFALAQWLEGYCKIRFESKKDTFRSNLEKIFKKYFSSISEYIILEDLVRDIVCYRNNLVHINKEDNLNTSQIVNLYEILKNMIYVLILIELNLEDRIKYTSEIKRKCDDYFKLKKSIDRCKNNT